MLSFLHHKGITEGIFKRASLSQKLQQLDDWDLQIQVIKLLSDIGKQDSKWNSFLFQEYIQDIKSYSLIEFDDQNQSYSIHPLVQHWSVWTIGQQQNNIQKCVLSIIGVSISWEMNIEDYKYQFSLLQHISSCISGIKLEDINILIAINLGHAYYYQGQWKKAKALEVMVMEKKKQILGDEHPDTLLSMANLAATYRDLGQWKKAEALEVVVMEKSKQILGDEHPDTLSSMASLAATYRNLGQWKEAEALEVVVMEKRKQILGEEHPDTQISMGNLACT